MNILKSNNEQENISLVHLQNLQKAAELSGDDIVFTNSPSRSEPVNVVINMEKEEPEISLEFIDYKDEKPETIRLNDYKYILSTLSLS